MRRATFAIDDRNCLDEQARVALMADQLGSWKFFPTDRFELRFLTKTGRPLGRGATRVLRRLLWHLHQVHPDVTLVIEQQCPSPIIS